jgi:hypothetical protein
MQPTDKKRFGLGTLAAVNAEVNFPTLGEVIFPTRRGSGDRPGLDQWLSLLGLPRFRFGG